MTRKSSDWMHTGPIRWLVGIAVCASAAALTFVVFSWMTQPASTHSDEEAAAGDRHDLKRGQVREIRSQRRVDMDDAQQLATIFETADDLATARYTLAVTGSILNDSDIRLSESGREKLESTLISALHDDRSRIRSTALASVRSVELHTRPDVQQRIIEMRDDESEHVAGIATRLAESIEESQQGDDEGDDKGSNDR